jgi:hypothetical protein
LTNSRSRPVNTACRRGTEQPICTLAPLASIDGFRNHGEQHAVEAHLRAAAIVAVPPLWSANRANFSRLKDYVR